MIIFVWHRGWMSNSDIPGNDKWIFNGMFNRYISTKLTRPVQETLGVEGHYEYSSPGTDVIFNIYHILSFKL